MDLRNPYTANLPKAGPGLSVHNGPSGPVFRARPQRVPAESHPFKVTAAGSGGLAIRIRLGLLNSLTPTVSGQPITADPPPTLPVPANYDGMLVLKVTTNADGIATAAELVLSEDAPEDTAEHGHLPIARVQAVGGALLSPGANQLVYQSLRHRMCGGVQHDFWGV